MRHDPADKKIQGNVEKVKDERHEFYNTVRPTFIVSEAGSWIFAN